MITFRQFMKTVRKSRNVGRLRKIEKYTGRRYRESLSDLPAWKGKTDDGKAVYVCKETGERDTWVCVMDDWTCIMPADQ